MATFKVTIDENSELGAHITRLSPRGRSREIYMLACLGLMHRHQNQLPDNSVAGKMPLEAEKVEQYTHTADTEKQSKNKAQLKQSDIVDFGDELLMV